MFLTFLVCFYFLGFSLASVLACNTQNHMTDRSRPEAQYTIPTVLVMGSSVFP